MVLLYYSSNYLLGTYQELLFEELKLEHVVFKSELAIGELNGLLCSARVVLRIDGFDTYNHWVVVISHAG